MSQALAVASEVRSLSAIAADIHAIHENSRRTVFAGALEIGQLLTEARPLFTGDEKGYLRWAEDEFGYRRRHVFNMLKLASEVQRVALLPSDSSIRQALAALMPASENGLDVHYSSETPEWYTPPTIIDRVVAVLGGIDLDPCADYGRQVPAARHFTADDDGLAQVWSGRVYMNPPYGDGIGDWTRKLADEVEAGNVSEAVALVPARTDTTWWTALRECAVCFVRGRLKFSGHENSAPFPSAAAYFGPRRAEFKAAFADVGDVWGRL